MEEQLGDICNGFSHLEVKLLAHCHFKDIISWISSEIAQGNLKDEGLFAHTDFSHRQMGQFRFVENAEQEEIKRAKRGSPESRTGVRQVDYLC